MSDPVSWIQSLFDDCLARAPFGVGWELDRARPPLVASVSPADRSTGQVRLDGDGVGARIDFACRLQVFLDVELEQPVPLCPAHRVGLTPGRLGDRVIWSCSQGDFQCEVGEYELTAFWPPRERDRWTAPMLSRRLRKYGVTGIAGFSVEQQSGQLVAKLALRPEANEQAVRDAAAPLSVEVENVPGLTTVRERGPAHEVLTIQGAAMRLALLRGTLRRADPEDDCDFLVGDARVRLAPDHLIGEPGSALLLDGHGVPFAEEGDEVSCAGGYAPPSRVRGGVPVFNAGAIQVAVRPRANVADVSLRPRGIRMTADQDIEAQIDQLESERESLQQDESSGMEPEHRHANRLEEIRVELDRLWDLRRQHNALREAGESDNWASERDADTVEGYEQ